MWILIYELIAGSPVAVPVSNYGQCETVAATLYQSAMKTKATRQEKLDLQFFAHCIDPSGLAERNVVLKCSAKEQSISRQKAPIVGMVCAKL